MLANRGFESTGSAARCFLEPSKPPSALLELLGAGARAGGADCERRRNVGLSGPFLRYRSVSDSHRDSDLVKAWGPFSGHFSSTAARAGIGRSGKWLRRNRGVSSQRRRSGGSGAAAAQPASASASAPDGGGGGLAGGAAAACVGVAVAARRAGGRRAAPDRRARHPRRRRRRVLCDESASDVSS